MRILSEVHVGKFYSFVCAGEFGVVYRGHLTGWRGGTDQGLVAVKTLKGLC